MHHHNKKSPLLLGENRRGERKVISDHMQDGNVAVGGIGT